MNCSPSISNEIGAALTPAAALEPPELLPGLRCRTRRICRCVAAGEDHSPRRGEGATDQRVRQLVLPGDLPRVDVESAVKVPHCSSPGMATKALPSHSFPRSKGRRVRDVVSWLVQPEDVHHLSVRAVGDRRPLGPAVAPGSIRTPVAVGWREHVLLGDEGLGLPDEPLPSPARGC